MKKCQEIPVVVFFIQSKCRLVAGLTNFTCEERTIWNWTVHVLSEIIKRFRPRFHICILEDVVFRHLGLGKEPVKTHWRNVKTSDCNHLDKYCASKKAAGGLYLFTTTQDKQQQNNVLNQVGGCAVKRCALRHADNIHRYSPCFSPRGFSISLDSGESKVWSAPCKVQKESCCSLSCLEIL